MKHITNFINEAASGRGNHTGVVKPCNNLVDEFTRVINQTKSKNSEAILVVLSSGAAAGEELINDFIDVASKNNIESFMFSSASDKLVKIDDARALKHQGPHADINLLIKDLIDNDDVGSYDFDTVYILSDGTHHWNASTAKLIKELIEQDAKIYGFSFGQEEYEMSCKIVGDGADYKNAMTGYFFNK
jgi:hypothetical protein